MDRRGVIRGPVLALRMMAGAACRPWRGDPTAPAVTPLGSWSPGMSLRQTFESFPKTGDETAGLRLLRSNTDAWIERWRLLDHAERAIDLSYFILHQDAFG